LRVYVWHKEDSEQDLQHGLRADSLLKFILHELKYEKPFLFRVTHIPHFTEFLLVPKYKEVTPLIAFFNSCFIYQSSHILLYIA
jgi:hypothetical protein